VVAVVVAKRLAMLAIAGMVVQELVTGTKL
jgi:hypothetical protein